MLEGSTENQLGTEGSELYDYGLLFVEDNYTDGAEELEDSDMSNRH